MSLRYYLTFIDEVPEAANFRRASSCEPSRVRSTEEELLSAEVEGLADRAAHLTRLTRLPPAAAPVPVPSLPTAVETGAISATSPGSRGHPELCRRPCLHFARGECPRGADCVYCHLPHPQRAVSLDKRMREWVTTLAPCNLLALVLPRLRACVDAMPVDFTERAGLCARAFLLALEQETARLGPPTLVPESQKILKRLNLMTLAMLMGLIVRCPAPSVALLAKEALEDLRRL
ncbi:unnamed protein product [Effrenium voratum]|uniref:C3H1-type domain-containing protein n=1 Tax=Effrenium voratum TaxID=2562239 RepID=A0AA36IUH1_9DINO|nr:unnamed protein product [Effrenium voratum]CAJ1449700.1 unnamed protein product [Effrenium voratum]